MFHGRHEEVLRAVALLGARQCVYTWHRSNEDGVTTEELISDWLATRCDCKYGTDVRLGQGRQTGEVGNGCPELRTLHSILTVLSVDEWGILLRLVALRGSGRAAALIHPSASANILDDLEEVLEGPPPGVAFTERLCQLIERHHDVIRGD